MRKLLAVFAVGAACASCLVIPAILAAIGGSGLIGGALATGYWGYELAFICLVLIALAAVFVMRSRKAPAACSVDNSCGCGPSREIETQAR